MSANNSNKKVSLDLEENMRSLIEEIKESIENNEGTKPETYKLYRTRAIVQFETTLEGYASNIEDFIKKISENPLYFAAHFMDVVEQNDLNPTDKLIKFFEVKIIDEILK